MGACKCVNIYFKQSVCNIINSIKNGILIGVVSCDVYVMFSL